LDVIPFDSFKENPEKADWEPRLEAVAWKKTACRKLAASPRESLTRGCEFCFAENQRHLRHQETLSHNGQSTKQAFKPPETLPRLSRLPDLLLPFHPLPFFPILVFVLVPCHLRREEINGFDLMCKTRNTIASS
jgi:hypothetical protein